MVTQQRNGKVEFKFYRPGAQHVTLAGDFNGWNPANLPMAQGPDGWWRCLVQIAPGCHHFRYLCDGEWFMDYAAFGLDYGPLGLNSVVSVESPTAAAAALTLVRSVAARTRDGTAGQPHRTMAASKRSNDHLRARSGGTLTPAAI